MTEITEARPPRFVHLSRGGAMLAHPLPARREATLPVKMRREHEKLVERVEQAGHEIARLGSELDGASARDREAATNVALQGAELPEPSKGRLRRELEQARRTRAALAEALRVSADRILETAAAKADEFASELERELGEATEAVRARIAALGESVAELGDLYAQASWTRWLVGLSGQSVSPSQRRRSGVFTATAGEIGRAGEAFEFELGEIAERRRQVAAERAEEEKAKAL